jgi:hypothetical protein
MHIGMKSAFNKAGAAMPAETACDTFVAPERYGAFQGCLPNGGGEFRSACR